jgi:hypothetical protein
LSKRFFRRAAVGKHLPLKENRSREQRDEILR